MQDNEDDFLDLYHTSPEEIEDIHDEGRFGSNLFFSHKPYFMTQHDNPKTYKYKIDKKNIVNVKDLGKHDNQKIKPILNRIMKRTGMDEQTSLDLLTERLNIYDYINNIEDVLQNNQFLKNEDREKLLNIYKKLKNEDIGELSWDIQHMGAQAAKQLGFKGVELQDEQGTSYLINMLNELKNLKLHE